MFSYVLRPRQCRCHSSWRGEHFPSDSKDKLADVVSYHQRAQTAEARSLWTVFKVVSKPGAGGCFQSPSILMPLSWAFSSGAVVCDVKTCVFIIPVHSCCQCLSLSDWWRCFEYGVYNPQSTVAVQHILWVCCWQFYNMPHVCRNCCKASVHDEEEITGTRRHHVL